MLFLSCRPFVVNTTFSTGLVGVEVTGKRPLGRPRRRWQDDIKMELEEIGISAGNWVDLAQNRDYWKALVNAALNLRVP